MVRTNPKIVTRPLQRTEVQSFVECISGNKEILRMAKAKCNSKLPTIITAYYRDEPTQFATWGFKSRRTTQTSEVFWLGGHDYDLLSAALQNCMYVSMLEGRKRVECFNEQEASHQDAELVLGDMWIREGHCPEYSNSLSDVNIYSHLWVTDGVPKTRDGVEYQCIVNRQVCYYRDKNIETYKDDELKPQIIDLVSKLLDNSGPYDLNIQYLPDWHGNELKSSV